MTEASAWEFGGGIEELPGVEWNAIAELSEPQLYAPGTELLRQGGTVRDVHIVRTGLVKLTHVTADGRAMICGLRPAGSVLGAGEALLSRSCPTSATTVVQTGTSRMGSAEFLALLSKDHTFSKAVLRAVCRDAHDATIEAIELGSSPAEIRLQHLLTRFAPRQPARDQSVRIKLQIPVKQGELAQLLAITPAYLCRLLAKMERVGTIVREKGWILVRNPGLCAK